MKTYPDLAHMSVRLHLLFDIGYSHGLLWSAKKLLKDITECGDYPIAVDELVERIEEFEAGRVQLVNEIYDNAEELAKLAKLCQPSTTV